MISPINRYMFSKFFHTRTLVVRSLFFGVVMLALVATLRAGAVPVFLPRNDAAILETLPLRATDNGTRQLRELRRAWQADPHQLMPALSLGRALANRAASDADPRYLGQAQAALAPWWDSPSAPPEVLLLRGQIEQGRHDFDPAVETFKRAVKLDPREPQGWLALASVYTVRGRYADARACCFRLASLADEATVAGATAGVVSMTGGAENALSSLEAVLHRMEGGSDSSLVARRLWCETLAGEIAERLGRPDAAEAHYRAALHLRPSDPYAKGVLADFLLEAGRFREVLQLLESVSRFDALLQRRTEALARIEKVPSVELKGAIETLTDRFAALAARGERIHLREEARFHLRLLHDPPVAQRLALENWGIQREAADSRLLLETSLAAGNQDGVKMALGWVRTNRLQDAIFQRLAVRGGEIQ